ncbi:MAG: type II toxin-antitoxin system prevent-host-death family antitoxin [Propionibacteriaceae bacterium]|jgi:prevent-host-death family protein|nr:type II toxin-antitoxin system prevent-host-death family antitoxin [Propionibacteriaceae bacterium]
MVQVNVQEAKATLSRLLVAAESGHEVVIARNGQPVVRLIPVRRNDTRTLGFMPGVVSDEVLRPLDDDDLRLWEGV